MSFHHFCGVAAIAFLALAIGACSPDTAPPDGDADAAAPEPAPKKDVTGSKPAVADSPAEKKQEPPKKSFDLLREGDRLVLSGRIRSELQARDIAAALKIDGLPLENKLEVDPKTPGIDWGNRVSELLPELVATVTDLHYHVEDGVITIKGTVKSEQDKNHLQRQIAYWMESPLITDMKNELKI